MTKHQPTGPDQPYGRRLSDTTWPSLATPDATYAPAPATRPAAASVLAVPVGSTEQHGPHLPFTVDTEIATTLGERLAAALPWIVLAPPVHYGSSGEHAGFPGTLSIGQQAVELLLTELVRSADAFAAVVLLSGHGGNAGPLRRAVGRLRTEGRHTYYWEPSGSPTDSHAGALETSVMLALRPEAVRLDQLELGECRPLPELLPSLMQVGLHGVTPNGVLGDPRTADAEAGHRQLDRWTAELLDASTTWRDHLPCPR